MIGPACRPPAARVSLRPPDLAFLGDLGAMKNMHICRDWGSRGSGVGFRVHGFGCWVPGFMGAS